MIKVYNLQTQQFEEKKINQNNIIYLDDNDNFIHINNLGKLHKLENSLTNRYIGIAYHLFLSNDKTFLNHLDEFNVNYTPEYELLVYHIVNFLNKGDNYVFSEQFLDEYIEKYKFKNNKFFIIPKYRLQNINIKISLTNKELT